VLSLSLAQSFGKEYAWARGVSILELGCEVAPFGSWRMEELEFNCSPTPPPLPHHPKSPPINQIKIMRGVLGQKPIGLHGV